MELGFVIGLGLGLVLGLGTWYYNPREISVPDTYLAGLAHKNYLLAREELGFRNAQLVNFLEAFQEIVYTGTNGWVKVSDLLHLIRVFSHSVAERRVHGETPEGGSVYRYGDDGPRSNEEQVAVNRIGDVEERTAAPPSGDPGK